MSMTRNREDSAPIVGPGSLRKGVSYSLISVVIGLFVSLFIGLGNPALLTPMQMFFGALFGLFISTGAWVTELLILSLSKGRLPNLPLRLFSYFLGGTLGHVAAHLLTYSLLRDYSWEANNLAFRSVVFGVFASVVGLAFYAYEGVQRRLREREEALRRSEVAAALAESELEIARSIQERLLPPPEIDGPGYVVSARNVAAEVVAGDFYDVFRDGDSSVCCVVGDVAGKGVGASLVMASVKAVLPLIASGRSVSSALDALNAKLHSELGTREFVALVLARFDSHGGRLQIANAGLPDPFLVRHGASPEAVSVLGQRLPLGAMAATRYGECEVSLAPGDRLLLYSDGLPEARIDGEELGYPRFTEIVARPAATASAWLDDILDALQEADDRDDDRTLVALERVVREPVP